MARVAVPDRSVAWHCRLDWAGLGWAGPLEEAARSWLSRSHSGRHHDSVSIIQRVAVWCRMGQVDAVQEYRRMDGVVWCGVAWLSDRQVPFCRGVGPAQGVGDAGCRRKHYYITRKRRAAPVTAGRRATRRCGGAGARPVSLSAGHWGRAGSPSAGGDREHHLPQSWFVWGPWDAAVGTFTTSRPPAAQRANAGPSVT
ncbi:hypothetical protein BP6252_03002 [Coleophoma cylindrospora]|uniref:Uncharacterized protein n=1 Tax=Coleophoma cylindrospora TaxID=1849047 RepID=A0A3D8S6S0_9HELO|nr:hypothetical protein BP6252_03002 [Coleophoma cylindrospora]